MLIHKRNPVISMLRCFPHIVVIKTEKESVGGGVILQISLKWKKQPHGYTVLAVSACVSSNYIFLKKTDFYYI